MKRILLLFAVLLLAAEFAAISIEPYGDSVYDLASGVTTLPQGGVIHDNENNLSIDASFIEYKEGEYIKAKEAKMETENMHFAATEIEYLPAASEIRLYGGVYLEEANIKGLKAQGGWIYLKDGVIVFSGGVTAAEPEFSTELLVADYRRGEVLLMAPYEYKDAKLGVTLRGKDPKKPLYLKLNSDSSNASTNSKVPTEVAKRLLGYIKQKQVGK